MTRRRRSRRVFGGREADSSWVEPGFAIGTRLSSSRLLHIAQHAIERRPIEIATCQHDAAYLLGVGDVFERIGIQEDKIRELAFLHRAQISGCGP